MAMNKKCTIAPIALIKIAKSRIVSFLAIIDFCSIIKCYNISYIGSVDLNTIVVIMLITLFSLKVIICILHV